MRDNIIRETGVTMVRTDHSTDRPLVISQDVNGDVILAVKGALYTTPVEYLLYAIISQHPHAFSQTTFDKVKNLVEEYGTDWEVPKSAKDAQTGVSYFFDDAIVTDCPFEEYGTVAGYEPEDTDPELTKLKSRLQELLDEAETITNTIRENHAS